MDVKQFENNRWQREDQAIQFRHKATLEMVEKGSTVLDLGSGDGLLLSLLKEKGVTGKGLDLSEEGVAKANFKGLDTKVFDFGNRLPFSDNSFDTVIALDVLEHLYDPESLLKEAKRVSKKHVIIGVPNFSSLPARIQVSLGRVPENNQPKKGHVFWFNYTVLKNMFTKNSLTVSEIKSNTIYQTVPFASLVLKFFSKVFPNMFCLSFVIKVSK